MRILRKQLTFDALVFMLLPIAFIGSGFLNMWAFILDGHRHEWFRQGFVLGIQAISAILFLIKACLIFRSAPQKRKMILCVAAIPCTFALVNLLALASVGYSLPWLKGFIIKGAYLTSSCLATIIIAGEKRLSSFLCVCRTYAFVLSPVVAYYCVRFYLPSAEYGVENLGILSYMPLAYCLLDFCILLLMRVLLLCASKQKPTFFWAEFFLYVLFATAITLSGTKGTILCLLWGSLLAFVYAAVAHRGIRYFGILMVSTFSCVAIFTTAMTPDYGTENRVVGFLKELDNPDSTKVTTEHFRSSVSIVQKASGLQDGSVDLVDFFNSGKAAEALAAGKISQEEYDYLKDIAYKLNHTAMGGRRLLWSQAFSEIKSAPLTGQGVYFYQLKYGTYPHNFFLELATDFGIPVMLLVAALGASVFYLLLKASLARPYIAAFVLFTLSYLPQKMVSGSLYDYTVFFQYGVCIVLLVLLRLKFFDQGEMKPLSN